MRGKLKTPYVTLVDYDFVDFYRTIMGRKKNTTKRQIRGMREIHVVHREIWREIYKSFVEVEGGVYIDGIGYFCHIMNPRRKWRLNSLTKLPRKHRTNGYRYNHILLNVTRSNQYYCMYKYLTDDLKKKLNILTPSKRYKFRLREVKSHINCSKRRKIVSLYK